MDLCHDQASTVYRECTEKNWLREIEDHSNPADAQSVGVLLPARNFPIRTGSGECRGSS